jgi:hypothetical protein
MLAANAYVIRLARATDDAELERLAQLDSAKPLPHPILIGELDGRPAAALSLHDKRTIADPFRHTTLLLTHLRVRAAAMEAYARTPNLADRVRAALSAAQPAAA